MQLPLLGTLIGRGHISSPRQHCQRHDRQDEVSISVHLASIANATTARTSARQTQKRTLGSGSNQGIKGWSCGCATCGCGRANGGCGCANGGCGCANGGCGCAHGGHGNPGDGTQVTSWTCHMAGNGAKLLAARC